MSTPAAAGQQRPLQIAVPNEAALRSALASKGLTVLEVHPDWCGPCRSVVPALRKARLEHPESALALLTVAAEAIEAACAQLEPVRERRGSSEPAFLFFRNGRLAASVLGANVPALLSNIVELTPAVADADDLDSNPFAAASRDANAKARAGATLRR